MNLQNLASLEFTAEANAETGDDIVKISGVAYSGKTVNQWYGATVVDLAGMEIARQIPLLNSHNNTIGNKIGEVKAEISDNNVLISGELLKGNEIAKYVAKTGKQSKWQLSIGASIVEYRYIRENEKASCNGMDFSGPILLVTKSKLREVSVVAVGADSDTTMVVNASLELYVDESIKAQIQAQLKEKESKMDPENEPQKTPTPPVPDATKAKEPESLQVNAAEAARLAVEAERSRVASINAICAGECPDICAKAIAEGWDEAQTTAKVLEAVRAKRPAPTPVNNRSENRTQEIEAAMCIRAGLNAEDLVKDYGEKVVASAEKLDLTLKDLCREAVLAEGGSISRVGFGNSEIRAAFSTVTLPAVLSNVANKRLLKGFQNTEETATTLCGIGNVPDFKVSNRVRMDVYGDLKEIPDTGEIPDSSVGEVSATNQAKTYGTKFTLSRQMIINDDLDEFLKIPKAYGSMSARLQDRLFYDLLLKNPTFYDGKKFFSKDHGNDLTAEDLTLETLKTAINLYGRMTDTEGKPIVVRPKYLVVPPELEITANELVTGSVLIAAGNQPVLRPASNGIASKGIRVLSTPWLTGKNWYLFCDKNDIETFELVYLKGKKTPTIEHGDTDYTTLGMWYRVYFDLGCNFQEYRGVVHAHP